METSINLKHLEENLTDSDRNALRELGYNEQAQNNADAINNAPNKMRSYLSTEKCYNLVLDIRAKTFFTETIDAVRFDWLLASYYKEGVDKWYLEN